MSFLVNFSLIFVEKFPLPASPMLPSSELSLLRLSELCDRTRVDCVMVQVDSVRRIPVDAGDGLVPVRAAFFSVDMSPLELSQLVFGEAVQAPASECAAGVTSIGFAVVIVGGVSNSTTGGGVGVGVDVGVGVGIVKASVAIVAVSTSSLPSKRLANSSGR